MWEVFLILFFRSDSTEHPEIKGTGLGLSIVKKLCFTAQNYISSQKDIWTSVI
jgi:signal transduction histidine kinase